MGDKSAKGKKFLELSKGCTILIEASARLMNVGATSPSWPAASSAEASHNDKIVPTS